MAIGAIARGAARAVTREAATKEAARITKETARAKARKAARAKVVERNARRARSSHAGVPIFVVATSSSYS